MRVIAENEDGSVAVTCDDTGAYTLKVGLNQKWYPLTPDEVIAKLLEINQKTLDNLRK